MNSKGSESKYRDVITFDIVPFKIIDDQETESVLKNPQYYPIVTILRQKPMTMRELERAYAKEAEMNETFEPKSDKTLYRYLKVLEESNLVVPVGQRVVIGKTATETLYGRTARMFLSKSDPDWWKTDEGLAFTKRVAVPVSHLAGLGEPDFECIQEFMRKFEILKQQEMENAFGNTGKDTLQLGSTLDWYEYGKLILYIEFFSIFLKNPNLLDELSRCFEKSSS